MCFGESADFQIFDCLHENWPNSMSFSITLVIFPLNFASPFSVMTHDFREIFLLKHYMFCIKRAHQCKIFQTILCSNERSANFLSNFGNHKARIYSNFASMVSATKSNSSVFLQLKPCILWTKRVHRKEIFKLLCGWVKTH